jgi:hypothetical protein
MRTAITTAADVYAEPWFFYKEDWMPRKRFLSDYPVWQLSGRMTFQPRLPISAQGAALQFLALSPNAVEYR